MVLKVSMIMLSFFLHYGDLNANPFKNIDKLTSFDPSLSLKAEDINIELMGIIMHSQPQAIFKYNGQIEIVNLYESIHQLTLIEIGKAKVKLKKNDSEIFEIYLGENSLQLTLNNYSVTPSLSVNSNTPDPTIKTQTAEAPEIIRLNKSLKQFMDTENISIFETKVIEELTTQPGFSNAGRVGWVMPESILGHPIEKIHLKPGDLVLSVNGFPAEKMNKIYNLYKDNSVKNLSIELKRGDTLVLLEIVRP